MVSSNEVVRKKKKKILYGNKGSGVPGGTSWNFLREGERLQSQVLRVLSYT